MGSIRSQASIRSSLQSSDPPSRATFARPTRLRRNASAPGLRSPVRFRSCTVPGGAAGETGLESPEQRADGLDEAPHFDLEHTLNRRAPRTPYWLAHLALILALALPGEALAQCGLLILENLGNIDYQGSTGSYDIFDPTAYAQPVSIRVTKILGTCDFAIGADEGQAGTYFSRQLRHGGSRLDYNLYTDPSLSNVLTEPGGGGAQLTGSFTTFDPLDSQVLTYYYSIPPLQVVPGTNANYSDTPRFSVYELDGGNPRGRSRRNIGHRAQVARTAELSLVETGAPFNASDVSQFLDFGIFYTGQALSFDLRGRANTDFDISLQSANGGVMTHTTFPGSNVPYTLTSNGSTIGLGGGGAVTIGSFSGGTTGPQGELYAITVTVGSLAGTVGGLHQDQITVTLTAR